MVDLGCGFLAPSMLGVQVVEATDDFPRLAGGVPRQAQLVADAGVGPIGPLDAVFQALLTRFQYRAQPAASEAAIARVHALQKEPGIGREVFGFPTQAVAHIVGHERGGERTGGAARIDHGLAAHHQAVKSALEDAEPLLKHANVALGAIAAGVVRTPDGSGSGHRDLRR
ncbi:MAG: hypothetical protein OEZ06_15055 [Myxococcales bacterium]|nr:hypothetical protein [Myxococcales bacterium]